MRSFSRSWKGGHRYDGEQLRIPAGFRAGDGVFETLRTYEGQPFRLRAHVARLLGGARAIGLKSLPPPASVEREVLRVLGESRARLRTGTEWILRPAIFSDGAGWGFLVTAEPWDPPPRAPRGLKVGISHTPHPGGYFTPGSVSVAVKWIARGPLSHALREARAQGWEEALLPDDQGRLIEGTRSNLWVLQGKTLIAPGPISGALPGITREGVAECATARGLTVVDRPVELPEIWHSNGVFLTSTLLGLSPVLSVNGRRVGKGPVRGDTLNGLRKDFDSMVRAETTGRR